VPDGDSPDAGGAASTTRPASDGAVVPPERVASASGDGARSSAVARLVRAAAAPHVILASLLFVVALVFFLAGGVGGVPRPERVEIAPPKPSATRTEDVRLVLVDAGGLERPRFVSLALPDSPAERFQVVLDALREAMMQDGSWPADLGAPRLFEQEANRSAVAVVDMPAAPTAAVDVTEELQLWRSITRTLLANGAADVRFLRGGRPTATLLGHVAVPSGL